MKKVLIIAYFYPPLNAIGPVRPASFADNFAQHGLYPIVITRHWKGDEKTYQDACVDNLSPLEITENEQQTVIRLPSVAGLGGFLNRFRNFPLVEKTLMSVFALFGEFHVKNNAYECLYDYLQNYLKQNKVDYIFATALPLSSIKLGHKLSVQFKIPFIADFRDLWDNNILENNYAPGLVTRAKNAVYEFYIKKWLKSAVLLTSVSESLLEEVHRLNPKAETTVIMNGFEEKLFSDLDKLKVEGKKKFVFSVIGTLYPRQDLSILISGMKLFLADKNLDEIQLNFIGTAYFEEVKQFLESNLPKQCTLITDRVKRDEALRILANTDVVFHAGWKGFRGIVSGKIFEYLGSKNKILIAPSDGDVMQKLISETKAGKTADTPEEFAAALNEWFAEWKSLGFVPYTGDFEKVLSYSRENQAAKLASRIAALD